MRLPAFESEYNAQRKSMPLLVVLSIIFPIQHFLLGKVAMGIFFWLTMGGFFVWWFIELFLTPSRVNNYNRELSVYLARDTKMMALDTAMKNTKAILLVIATMSLAGCGAYQQVLHVNDAVRDVATIRQVMVNFAGDDKLCCGDGTADLIQWFQLRRFVPSALRDETIQNGSTTTLSGVNPWGGDYTFIIDETKPYSSSLRSPRWMQRCWTCSCRSWRTARRASRWFPEAMTWVGSRLHTLFRGIVFPAFRRVGPSRLSRRIRLPAIDSFL